MVGVALVRAGDAIRFSSNGALAGHSGAVADAKMCVSTV
jgi:hypothetical protein